MATWIPESERDESYEIFHTLFLCRVRVIDTMSVDYIREYGVPSSGDPEIDRGQAYGREERYLTINDMVEFHKRNVAISIISPQDTLRIHEIIQRFLKPWAERIKNSLAIGDAPLEDLLAIDEFGEKIYPHAKRFFPEGSELSLFTRKLRSLASVSAKPVLTLPGSDKVDPTTENQPEQVRESFAQTFANKRNGLGKRGLGLPSDDNGSSKPNLFGKAKGWR